MRYCNSGRLSGAWIQFFSCDSSRTENGFRPLAIAILGHVSTIRKIVGVCTY
jgi:hypothetical protein